MAKHKDQTPTPTKPPGPSRKDSKAKPPSGGRIRTAVARRITRHRRVTFTPATFRIAGPLSFTRGGMFASYVLGGQQWDFRSDSDRTLLWDQATFRWASLKGRTIKLRSTPLPYPS